MKKCCGLPMNTLEVFGIRIYSCSYRGHHPMIFQNLSTGEELTESYDDGADGGLTWASPAQEEDEL